MNRKNIKIIFLLVLICISLFYVFNTVIKYYAKLPDYFQKSQLESISKKVITDINSDDYSYIFTLGDETFKNSINEQKDQIKSKYIDKAGKIKEINIKRIAGHKDPKTKKVFAKVIANSKNEHKKISYMLFFDRDYKLVAIYMN